MKRGRPTPRTSSTRSALLTDRTHFSPTSGVPAGPGRPTSFPPAAAAEILATSAETGRLPARGVPMSDYPETSHRVTSLLQQAGQGNRDAANMVVEIVHAELHRLAGRCMGGERPGHILQTTALVNEAYLRLFGSDTPLQLNNRRHFFAVAATQMRRILVDEARSQ